MAESDFDRLDFRAGDPLLARDLDTLAEAVRRRLQRVTGGNGVDAIGDRRGVALTARRPTSFVGVASGTISARSGSTWGTGKVTRYGFDGTADYSNAADYDVVNPSAAIPSGRRCVVAADPSGFLVVRPLEPMCGRCQLGGTLAAASGWPSTPTTTTATVYVEAAGALVSIGTQTVVNWRNVSWPASRTSHLVPNDSGSWDIVDQDC